MRYPLDRMIAAACVLLLAASQAHAQLEIVISKGVDDALPIAIVPLGWKGDAPVPYDLSAVVDEDLRRSGRFSPMSRDAMLEKPSAGHEVDFADWRLLGADFILVGELEPGEVGGYVVKFQLFDVIRQKQMLGYSLPVDASQLRDAAHYMSDMVFESITGMRGAFSTRIAYVTVNRQGAGRGYELVVADADGENPQVIVESPGALLSPSWSPDGEQLAYVVFEGAATAIYAQNVATGQRRQISKRKGVNGAPAWSPDGRRLALTLSDDGNLDIYVKNLVDGTMSRVTRHSAIDTEPVWSRDGSRLYFNSDRSGGPQVYTSNLSGDAPRRLTFEGNYNARPRISPDGSKMAVVHNDRGNYRIAVVDLESGATQILTDGRLDESPSFAPNGSMIIYATESRGRGVLAAVSVDGRVSQTLSSRGGDVREPVWAPYKERR